MAARFRRTARAAGAHCLILRVTQTDLKNMNMETSNSASSEQLTSADGMRLSIMGAEGSGKTCFFAGLALLGDSEHESPFGIIGRDKKSQSFINDLKQSLRRSELPASTHGTVALSIDVLLDGCRVAMSLKDFAGEDFRSVGTELKADDPLYETLRASTTILLFLDIEADVESESPDNAERLDAALNLLSTETLCDGQRRLAVVITKADLRDIDANVVGSLAAERYLQEHKPALAQKIEALGYRKAFFFLSPIGRSSLDGDAVPTPAGYEPLFRWIIGNVREPRLLEWLRRHRIAASVAAIVLAVSIAGGGYCYYERWKANHIVAPPVPEGPVDIPPPIPPTSRDIRKADLSHAAEYADRECDGISKGIEDCHSLADVNDLRARLRTLWDVRKDWEQQTKDRFTAVEKSIKEKEENIRVDEIERMFEQDREQCRDLISQYNVAVMEGSCSGGSQDKVNVISNSLKKLDLKDRLDRITSIVPDAKNPRSLLQKCDAIDKCVSDIDKPDRDDVRRAVQIARRLASGKEYSIVVVSATGLSKPRRTQLELRNGRTGVKEETKPIVGKEPQWNATFKLQWSPGDPLSVEWLWNSHLGFTNTRIAYKEFRDPFCALLDMLAGEESLATKDGMCHAATTGKADVRFSCDDFPDPKNDLRVFHKYIFPGKYWEEKGQP